MEVCEAISLIKKIKEEMMLDQKTKYVDDLNKVVSMLEEKKTFMDLLQCPAETSELFMPEGIESLGGVTINAETVTINYFAKENYEVSPPNSVEK